MAGVDFVGGTLWADGRLGGPDTVPGRASGERIQVGDRPITSGDEEALHARTRGVIEAALARPRDMRLDRRLVVLTHQAPHPLCLPAAGRTRWAAGNAASNLSALTDAGRVAVWVHGHVHARIDLTRPDGTRIVCNAAGLGFTNPGFLDDWVIEV